MRPVRRALSGMLDRASAYGGFLRPMIESGCWTRRDRCDPGLCVELFDRSLFDESIFSVLLPLFQLAEEDQLRGAIVIHGLDGGRSRSGGLVVLSVNPLTARA